MESVAYVLSAGIPFYWFHTTPPAKQELTHPHGTEAKIAGNFDAFAAETPGLVDTGT